MFQQPPAGGDQVKVAELVGSLVLIYALEYKQGVSTVHGLSDVVSVDMHVLQGPKAGESYENTLIFQKALIGSLKAAVGGEPVLARIGTGIAKPGQTAPYVLQPFTPQDAAIATAWLQARSTAFQAPPAATAQPAAAPGTGEPIDLASLPPAVLELLKQSGQVPPF